MLCSGIMKRVRWNNLGEYGGKTKGSMEEGLRGVCCAQGLWKEFVEMA